MGQDSGVTAHAGRAGFQGGGALLEAQGRNPRLVAGGSWQGRRPGGGRAEDVSFFAAPASGYKEEPYQNVLQIVKGLG